MDNFQKKFLEEAYDHVNDLEQSLLELESNPANKEIIEKVFRAMHSLKGGSAMFGFEKISEFTHDLENIYDLVRNDQLNISRELLTLTLESVDHLKDLLNADNLDENELNAKQQFLLVEIQKIVKKVPVHSDNHKEKEDGQNDDEEVTTYYILFQPHEDIFNNGTNPLYLIDELHELGEALVFPHLNKLPVLEKLIPEDSYVYWEIILTTPKSLNDITDVFIFVEDNSTLDIQVLSHKNLAGNKTFVKKIHKASEKGGDLGLDNIKKIADNLKPSMASKVKKAIQSKTNLTSKESTISSIRVSSDKLDNLMNLVSELVTTQARLALFTDEKDLPELSAISENVQKLSRQLRDIAFSIVLIPIENMITRFHRLIRDLSGELKKEVQFVAEGTDTELDKTIIESLTDPLLHIMRNSMDHGIETPELREKKGKSREGTIKLSAFYSGANVHIQISDDGNGIDPEIIRDKAISKGIISPETPLTQKETLDLIFLPGFSTATSVTDVSGRGVGMDVVKRKIADIRGEVDVESVLGKGTTLTIKLPLTLSIIDGLLVRLDDTHYILPLSVIDKIYAAEHNKVINTFNHVVVLEGEQFPFFNLREEFKLPESSNKVEEVVVVHYEDKKVGLVVDNVVGEYQAVLKPLGKYYKNQDIISGATILGDGTIALVLDTNKAIKQFSDNNKLLEEAI